LAALLEKIVKQDAENERLRKELDEFKDEYIRLTHNLESELEKNASLLSEVSQISTNSSTHAKELEELKSLAEKQKSLIHELRLTQEALYTAEAALAKNKEESTRVLENLTKASIVKEQALREEMLRNKIVERQLREAKLEIEELTRSPRAAGTIVTPRTEGKVAKIQAVVRGFLDRVRVAHHFHRTRVHHAALAAGVLFAMKNTVQGETGWYCAPDGSVYYFVLEEGEYLMACGPLSMDEYEALMTLSEDKKKKSKAGAMFTMSQPSAAMSSSSSSSSSIPSKLMRCDLNLIEGLDIDDGKIYIASENQKLYVTIPLDGRVFDMNSMISPSSQSYDCNQSNGLQSSQGQQSSGGGNESSRLG